MEQKEKKSIFKKWWFWVLAVIGLFILIGILSPSEKSGTDTTSNTPTTTPPTAESSSSATPTSTETKTEEPKKEAEAKTNNVPADYKSALSKATSYSQTMHMSKKGIYDQLVSEYGEQFSAEAAQYAIDNVKADWNANALAKAKSYQDTMSMSPSAIHDQLTSEHGEKFTQSEADYAIQHIND